MICTFFGHKDTPEKIQPILRGILIDLIENKDAHLFYVGNHGKFDNMVQRNLKLLKDRYKHIGYAVVLAYMPGEKDNYNKQDYTDTIYPDGLESTPPKYAIVKRNKWMIDNSDYVVTYVKYNIGGAAKCKKLAEKKGLPVLNLADLEKN